MAYAPAVSGTRVVQGLAPGEVTAVALGAVVGLPLLAVATVDPPLQRTAFPRLGLILLFILQFGKSETPKLQLVALGVALSPVPQHLSAIGQIDRRYFETAEVLGFSWKQPLSTIILPSIAPRLLVGLLKSLAAA